MSGIGTNEPVSLVSIGATLRSKAADASSGHSAQSIGHDESSRLRQTVIALRGGSALSDHESPGSASLQVIDGTVELHTADHRWTCTAGDIIQIPPARHGVDAVTDALVLLTVALSSDH